MNTLSIDNLVFFIKKCIKGLRERKDFLINENTFFNLKNIKDLNLLLDQLNIKIKEKNFFLKILNYDFFSFLLPKLSVQKFNDLNLPIIDNVYRIVFVNGDYSPLLSDSYTGEWNINIEQNVSYNNKEMFDKKRMKIDFFFRLINYLSNKIISISLNTDKCEHKPIYLLHINTGLFNKNNNILNMFYYCYSIKMLQGSGGKIIEHFINLDNNSCFYGIRSIINIEDNVRCDYIKLFTGNTNYGVSYTNFFINNESFMDSNILILGLKSFNGRFNIQLKGNNSKLLINSLSIPILKNVHDVVYDVNHIGNCCTSRQVHKVIANNGGIGIFEGLIKIFKNSLNSDAHILNNNLLLDNKSTVISNPNLKIESDNVKCGHASTVGYINYDHIFYFCSRGISYKKAKLMIIYSFISVCIKKINNLSIRKEVYRHIMKLLLGNTND